MIKVTFHVKYLSYICDKQYEMSCTYYVDVN